MGWAWGVFSPVLAPAVRPVLSPAGRGCPAATHFSLLRQRKVSKRKATLVAASLRFATGNLRCSVQPGSKTTRFAQTSFCPYPSGPPLLGASTSGGDRNTKQPNTNTEYLKKQGHAMACPCLYLSWFYLLPPLPIPIAPCGCAEERRARRIRAKTCLSRRRVVFDPVWTEHRRLPAAKRRDADTRVAFSFAYFSFGEAKEK